MTPRDKRQRTFKLSGVTETQLARLSLATGSGATAVVEQAVAHYFRQLFGTAALHALVDRAAPLPDRRPDGLADEPRAGDGLSAGE